jgi:hypothetical protein
MRLDPLNAGDRCLDDLLAAYQPGSDSAGHTNRVRESQRVIAKAMDGPHTR